MSPATETTPIYILKWRPITSERGRRHMALFVPSSPYKHIHPTSGSEPCKGALYQVRGAPMAGFGLDIKRNWSISELDNVNFVQLLRQVDSRHVQDPPTNTYEQNAEMEARPLATLDNIAQVVRLPGPSQPLWDANSIIDCQDWIFDYMTYLSQRRMIDAAVLTTLQSLQDPRTALMRPPGSPGSDPDPAQILTASIARPTPHQLVHPSPAGPSSRGQYSKSEWDDERRVFKRYDTRAQRWEYRDQTSGWTLLA